MGKFGYVGLYTPNPPTIQGCPSTCSVHIQASKEEGEEKEQVPVGLARVRLGQI